MTPDELWEKYYSHARTITRQDFLAALTEYGAAVRAQDVKVCKRLFRHWAVAPTFTVTCPTAKDCADAIEKMELP